MLDLRKTVSKYATCFTCTVFIIWSTAGPGRVDCARHKVSSCSQRNLARKVSATPYKGQIGQGGFSLQGNIDNDPEWYAVQNPSGVILPGPSDRDVINSQCLLQINGSMQQIQKTPSTTCSAYVRTEIGNYMLYGSSPPHMGMLGYPLGCAAPNFLGQEMLFVRTPDYVRQIKVSKENDPVVVALHESHPPSIYLVKTTNEHFQIIPSTCVIPSPFVSAVDTADTNDYTVMAFAVNNYIPHAPLRDQYSPIYLADTVDRNVTQCGFAAVKNAVAVNFWKIKDQLLVTFVVQFAHTIRTILRIYTVEIHGRHSCSVKPWASQPTIGTSLWRTQPSPQSTFGYSTPFTVDQMLCGITDAQVISTPDFTALVVGISNQKDYEESACPQEETLALQSDDRTMRTICGCSYAIKRSFVIFYNETVGAFVLDLSSPSSFFLLDDGPDLTMEIKAIQLSCCTMVQLSSITGVSQLYTLGRNEVGDFFVARVNGTGLPSVVQSSTVGNCDDSNAVIGYHRTYPMAGLDFDDINDNFNLLKKRFCDSNKLCCGKSSGSRNVGQSGPQDFTKYSALIYRISCRDSQDRSVIPGGPGEQQLVLTNTSGGEFAAWSSLRANHAEKPYVLKSTYPGQTLANVLYYDDNGVPFPTAVVSPQPFLPQPTPTFRGGEPSQRQYYQRHQIPEGYSFGQPPDRAWQAPLPAYGFVQQPPGSYYSRTSPVGVNFRRAY